MNNDLKQPSQPGMTPTFDDPPNADFTSSQPSGLPQGDAITRPTPPPARSLKKDGVALKDKAMDRLATEADSRKSDVSKQLKGVSGALQTAEKELAKKDSAAAEWTKSGLHQVVTKIEQFADHVATKDSRELIGEVRSFARENPKTFIAACAAAGFAAARVFKAGGSDDRSQPMGMSTTGYQP